MERKDVKNPSLFSLFIKYLITFCIGNVIVAVLLLGGYFYGIASGMILPANYAEKRLEQVKAEQEGKEFFDADSIPFTCTYVRFDKNGNVIEGNMKKDHLEDAKKILAGDAKTVRGYYMIIKQTDSSCLIKYDLMTHFASPFLHRIMNNPGLLFLGVFIIFFLLLIVITAMKFGKTLKVQLEPMIMATNAIKEQDLMFQITPTKVKEFNAVLDSIADMKDALKASLERQWEEEQSRRTQMAALIHDIKTPLTLVRGNAELLIESTLPEEELELSQIIYQGAEKIEQYITLMMDTATAENLSSFHGQEFLLEDLIAEIAVQAKALCKYKQLAFAVQEQELPHTLYGDRTLIFRGIMNILDNAVEYSPHQGKISLYIKKNHDMLECTVMDQGRGFSAAGLKQAAKQFFTEQQERSGKHYGMGLFLAKSVAEKHGGQLMLANQENGCGAIVTMTVSTLGAAD